MKRVLLSSLLVTAIVGACFYLYYALPTVSVLKQRNPRATALMELRDEEYRNKGIDVDELKAALKKDWETMSFSRGGSTITMQLAKNLYLSPSKNPLRKIKEIVIAWQLEQALSKRRIFEIYLNIVEWGRNVYGAEAAARFYFGKSAATLDPLEAATLAALVPSPRSSKERNILSRRNLILGRLASVCYISNEEYQHAKQIPLFQKVEEKAPELPEQEE